MAEGFAKYIFNFMTNWITVFEMTSTILGSH